MLLEEILFSNTDITNPEKFSIEVERRYIEEGDGASYIEITSAYLEELGIEAEEGKNLISKGLYDKIENEAKNRNLLKEKNTTISLV